MFHDLSAKSFSLEAGSFKSWSQRALSADHYYSFERKYCTIPKLEIMWQASTAIISISFLHVHTETKYYISNVVHLYHWIFIFATLYIPTIPPPLSKPNMTPQHIFEGWKAASISQMCGICHSLQHVLPSKTDCCESWSQRALPADLSYSLRQTLLPPKSEMMWHIIIAIKLISLIVCTQIKWNISNMADLY